MDSMKYLYFEESTGRPWRQIFCIWFLELIAGITYLALVVIA